ncbi:MAG TPA: prolyl oligopeptidase family serine peptidase [Steroidobacteraceae bacterium]|nr:prolyl oligopeptidase family serine peptidase [Steroidobacteraceae bacterium]
MRFVIAVAMLCIGVGRWCEAAETAEAAPTRLVHRYLGVEISPNGEFVASVEGDSSKSGGAPTVRDLVIRPVRSKGKAITIPMPCGRVPQCWPDSPTWSPDAKHLGFALRTPGSHARSVYTVGAEGGGLTKLLDFSGTIVHLRYLPDGRLAMLAIQNATKEVGATQAGAAIAGDLDAAPPEQRIATLENGTLNWVSPPDLFVYEYDWRAGGKGFVGTAAPGDGDNNWWTAKLYAFPEGGAARVIYTPADARQQLAMPKVSRDGSRVAFIAGIMSDFGSTGGDVYTLDLNGNTATNLTPDMHASATAIAWRCDDHLQAELLAGDKTQFVDLGSGTKAAPTKVLWSGEESFGDRAGGISTACPSGVTADAHESFTQAPEIEIGAIGHWRNLTDANSGLSLAGRVQSVWWKNDGFDIQGWLLLPLHAEGKLPMVTMVHGGPASAVTPGFAGPGTTTELLEHGYAVFKPNPRGSYGQGERFTQANVRDFGHGDLRDIMAGIDAAAKVAPIDTARLGLTGGSYGGFMSMWAVTQTDRFKAVVAAAGISDWLSYYGENGIDAWMIPYFGKSAYDDPAVYAASSAINYIHNVKTPTFAYVGEFDIECPAPQTQEFWHAMKAMNVPTSVMIYPGEGHGLRDPKHLADAEQRTMAWFDKYLK